MTLDRASSMYERDKNHPCIFAWSLGNESWTGDNFKRSSEYFHAQDKKRLVHYQGEVTDEGLSPYVDMKSLADVACLSSPYLIRLFKREVGLSPIQYVNRKKAERAQLLLCTTDSPVKEIAFATGFSDQSYFIRLFRKICGVTPQEYRLRMRASR